VDAGEFGVIGSTILLVEISLISSTIKQESVILLVKEMANCTVIPPGIKPFSACRGFSHNFLRLVITNRFERRLLKKIYATIKAN
jgi:hypothetical protein